MVLDGGLEQHHLRSNTYAVELRPTLVGLGRRDVNPEGAGASLMHRNKVGADTVRYMSRIVITFGRMPSQSPTRFLRWLARSPLACSKSSENLDLDPVAFL